ncbi:MAG TPA: hypothetical protein VG167_15040 [Verrucomicrobiae bacterium]|nr:hypothetical protein [Verrucomicrobiae bacterium]
MNAERTQRILVLLTFLGMVGLYVGAYLAYQKYQSYQTTLQQRGTVGGILSILTGH